LLSAAFLLPALDQRLTEIKTVYVLSMANGFDQYLTNRLTKAGPYQVVTDPLLADAVVTDVVGRSLEQRLTELYPPPPEAEPAEDATKPAADAKKAAKEDPNDIVAAMGQGAGIARISSFSRGRGNVFIVDLKSRRVVWSHYRRPKNSRPDELNRTADGIVDRLNEDLLPKK
jgi:hypothetical protein